MSDLDAAIVTVELLQLFLDLGRISHEIKFLDVAVFLQGHDRAADNIRRPKIAAHGIQCDFHRSGILRPSFKESKTKFDRSFRAKSRNPVELPHVSLRGPSTALGMTATTLPRSALAALCNNRTMGRRYARRRCSRTGCIY